MLTLPCLYVFEVILHCKALCALVQGRDIHQYETRGRDGYRTPRHRTTAFEHLPGQAGVTFINRLPEDIKSSNDVLRFKAHLKRRVVYGAFYSVDESMANR